MKEKKDSVLLKLLLFIAFVTLCLPAFYHAYISFIISRLIGMALFLVYVIQSANKYDHFLGAFLLGIVHIVTYPNITGALIADVILLMLVGISIYLGMLVYKVGYCKSATLSKTLLFPLVWLVLSFIFQYIQLPVLLRFDMFLFDFKELIQIQHIITSYGMNLLLVWMMSLLAYALLEKKVSGLLVIILLGCLTYGYGTYRLNHTASVKSYLRVAYTTGPYIGDFVNYSDVDEATKYASLENSVKSAREQGAKILAFNEEAFTIDAAKEEAFVDYCRDLAKEYHLYILIGFDEAISEFKSMNKIVFISKEGEILDSYTKHHTIPLIESDYAKGDGRIPIVEVEIDNRIYRVAFAICYDSNFPVYLSQIQKKADFLFLPSWDWEGITKHHYRICGIDAVELGLTLLKPTYDGYSIAVDQYGQVISLTHTKDTGYENVQIVDLPQY